VGSAHDGGSAPGTSDASINDAGALDSGWLDSGWSLDSGWPIDSGWTLDSGGGPAPECTALEACCQQIGSSLYPGCESIVNSNYALSCSTALQDYKSGGYCTGGTHCQTLAACCSQLPATWQSGCNSEVELNNDPACQQLFATYQTDGYCGGGPQGACTSLEACCEQLDPSSSPTCQAYVNAGSQTDCNTIHNSYRTAGLCN
jgi:hypothetical protein